MHKSDHEIALMRLAAQIRITAMKPHGGRSNPVGRSGSFMN
jgi:hypothetical protein